MTAPKPDTQPPNPDVSDRYIASSPASRSPDPPTPSSSPPPVPRQQVAPGDPYCASCGYLLKDLTDSSKCPECGKPLVHVLVRGRASISHKQRRFRTEATLFGLPIIDLCLGLDEHGKIGRAKGIIAIGDIATGGIAIGNKWATGIFACGGGGSAGLCAVGGGMSLGLLTAVAGGAGIGGISLGGFAAGGIASGGAAVAFVAQGGTAVGFYARGGGAIGVHTIDAQGPSSQHAIDTFAALEPYIGRPTSGLSMLTPLFTIAGLDILVAGIVLALAAVGHRRWKRLSR
ncbi:MAG: hypothetical protein AB7G11_11580 [Phycisphaerales bacterium]